MTGTLPKGDLTRWNQAGLDRFRYVDANAATHLEELRHALHHAFPDWVAMKDPALPENDEQARLLWLVEQLYSDRKDWGFEITRAFCRALHVTSEHIDAFANESYLPTATQWESLRLLVSMIGYVPLPQSSAAAPLVILAPDDIPPAILPAGTAVKNVPTAAIPALIFETEKDLLVDPVLNGLHLEEWDRNPNSFDPFLASADWPIGEDSKIDIGQVAILIETGESEALEAYAVAIEEVVAEPAEILLKSAGVTASALSLRRGATSLVATPKSILTPILNGPSTVRFEHPHGLGIGETVYLTAGTEHRFGEVQYADKYAVALVVLGGLGASEFAGDIRVYRTRRFTKQQRVDRGDTWYIAGDLSASAYLTYRQTDFLATPLLVDSSHIERVLGRDEDDDYDYENAFRLKGEIYQTAEELILSDPLADELVGVGTRYPPRTSFDFEGSPPKLSSGDWLMAVAHDDRPTPVRIASIEHGDGDFTIHLDGATAAYVAFFHSEFQEVLRPFEYDVNDTPLSAGHLVPVSKPWPAGMVAGRDIILENITGEGSGGVTARVTGINAVTQVLETDLKAEEYEGFTIGNAVIRANVVIANHGEAKPTQILGNGDASLTSQSFVFDVDGVTHVSDPAHAGGVRADVEVWAGGVRFTQVDELRNSKPTDTHFHVRLNEDSHLVLTFGDGLAARRLPTGINNIQIGYRVGGGEVGNIPAYTLSKPVGKVALIDELRQPVAASGGGAAEPLEDLRRNAPASVLAMNRAVSLRDYENLANRYAGVWHAAAFEEKRAGRLGDVVVLAIMPAGAEPFLGTLQETLKSSLESRGLPGIPVEVQAYVPARPELTVELTIDETRYVSGDVLDAVSLALRAEFQPKNRRPGRPLHRSEIVAVIENVEGVTSSVLVELSLSKPGDPVMRDVRYGSEGAVWSFWPEPNCAVFLDEESVINLTVAGETP